MHGATLAPLVAVADVRAGLPSWVVSPGCTGAWASPGPAGCSGRGLCGGLCGLAHTFA